MYKIKHIRINVSGCSGVGKTSIISSYNGTPVTQPFISFETRFDKVGNQTLSGEGLTSSIIEIHDNSTDMNSDATLILVNANTWLEEVQEVLLRIIDQKSNTKQIIYVGIAKTDLTSKQMVDKATTEMIHILVSGIGYPKCLGNHFRGCFRISLVSSLDDTRAYTKKLFETIASEAFRNKSNPHIRQLTDLSANYKNAMESSMVLKRENIELRKRIDELQTEKVDLEVKFTKLQTTITDESYISQRAPPIPITEGPHVPQRYSLSRSNSDGSNSSRESCDGGFAAQGLTFQQRTIMPSKSVYKVVEPMDIDEHYSCKQLSSGRSSRNGKFGGMCSIM